MALTDNSTSVKSIARTIHFPSARRTSSGSAWGSPVSVSSEILLASLSSHSYSNSLSSLLTVSWLKMSSSLSAWLRNRNPFFFVVLGSFLQLRAWTSCSRCTVVTRRQPRRSSCTHRGRQMQLRRPRPAYASVGSFLTRPRGEGLVDRCI